MAGAGKNGPPPWGLQCCFNRGVYEARSSWAQPGVEAASRELSALNKQAALPSAKDRWAMGPLLGCCWDGGIRQRARHTRAPSPLCGPFRAMDLGRVPPPEPCFPRLRAG